MISFDRPLRKIYPLICITGLRLPRYSSPNFAWPLHNPRSTPLLRTKDLTIVFGYSTLLSDISREVYVDFIINCVNDKWLIELRLSFDVVVFMQMRVVCLNIVLIVLNFKLATSCKLKSLMSNSIVVCFVFRNQLNRMYWSYNFQIQLLFPLFNSTIYINW